MRKNQCKYYSWGNRSLTMVPQRRFSSTSISPPGEETPLLHSSGIGLWLMYWATTALGGTLSYTENEPHGSVVRFEVPAADTSS